MTSYKNTTKLSEHVNLGLACGALGNYQGAADCLQKALDIDPGDATVRFGLGVALSLAGNRTAALEQYLILRKVDTRLSYELYALIKNQQD